MKTNQLLVVIAVALFAITGNLTYSNVTTAKAKKTPAAREEVVEVVGRYTTLFDGFGASLGFLVKTSHGLEVLPYDQGSMADHPDWQPKYLSVYWSDRGERPTVVPASVQKIQ